MRRTAIISICCLLLAVAATATEQYAQRLPLHDPFGCANCHLSDVPLGGDDLNAFGRDFRDNGNIWNEVLAALDSDGDGCNNGAELGDVDGDGQPDQGITRESSNPGVAGDCTASIPDITWGRLKVMFNGQK